VTPTFLIYRVGEVEVDPARRCLLRNGLVLRLRPRSFDLLLYLLQNPERVVSKDELLENLWKDTAVTESSLVQCVIDVRRALGDDAKNPAYIRTAPRLGYQLIAPVSRRSGGVLAGPTTSVELYYEEEEEITDLAVTTPPGRKNYRLIAAAAALIAALGAGWLGWRAWSGPRPELSLPRIQGGRAVTVMYFENQSGSRELEWLRGGLADMLIANLARSPRIAVLSRQQLNMLFDAGAAGSRLRLDQALSMARRSHAQAFVLGSFARLGEQISISVQLHDGRNGSMLAAERVVADRADQIPSRVDDLGLRLAGDLGVPLTAEQRRNGLANLMTDNLEAYRDYSVGIEKASQFHQREAIELFEKAVALDPRFAMAHARIGYTHSVAAGRLAEGKPYLEKAFRLSDRLGEKDRLSIAAWYALANRDYPSAIGILRRIVALYPDELEAYQLLARLLTGEERFEEAQAVARQALEVDPYAPATYNEIGQIHVLRYRFDDAIAAMRQLVSLSPAEPNAWDSLGLAYEAAGRFSDAEAAYHRAIGLQPDFEIAIIHLGNVLYRSGRYREALARYEEYLRAAPGDLERARGYDAMGNVYERLGDSRRATAALARAASYSGIFSLAAYRQALHAGDIRRVDELLARVNDNPGRGQRLNARFQLYLLGEKSMATGRSAEALGYFRETLARAPPFWSHDWFEDCLADALLRLGRVTEAIAEYRRVLQRYPALPLPRYHLAEACARAGRQGEAREEMRRFLKLWEHADPDIPELSAARRFLAGAPPLT
jgi:tetratricopeptide (TPR) repeat protein/DNA-binding winged helix-turn-helix (wHTH) protein